MGSYDDGAFQAAYDKVLAKWPADREAVTVPTRFGDTHVLACGPREAPPLLLLPGGGGATATSWFALAADLAEVRRVYAVDLMGAAGRTAARGARDVDALGDWLDEVAAGLRIGSFDLGGHSYGGWIALHHALRAPQRVRRLFLLDPTRCFAGFETAYLLRALPMLLRPSPRRVRAFLDWECGGAVLDADWLRLQEAAAGFPAGRPVTGPRPSPKALRALRAPVLLCVAANSRTHDAREVAARAEAWLPNVRTVVLRDASHHSLPVAAPVGSGRRLIGFLDG